MMNKLYRLLLKALMIVSIPYVLVVAGSGDALRSAAGLDTCPYAVSAIRTNFAEAQDMLRRAEGLLASIKTAERDSLERLVSEYRTRLQALQTETGDPATAVTRLGGCAVVREISLKTQSLIAEMRREEGRIRLYVGSVRRINQMIRRTDAALYRASQLARKADADPQSFTTLRRAFDLQEGAKQKLLARDLNGALRGTVQARLLVAQTTAAALDSVDVSELKDEARQFYEKTGEMIAEVQSCIAASGDPRGTKLLSLAREHQSRAREAVDSRDPAKAIRNARAARKIVTEINRLCRQAKGDNNRLDRLEAKIAEAQEIVTSSGNQAALQIFTKGKERAVSAKRLLEQGKTDKARIEGDIAAKLIAKSVDVAQEEENRKASDAGSEIRITQVIVNKAGSAASTDAQRAQVKRAQELVDQARTAVKERRQCLALLDKATDIAIEVISQRRAAEAD